MVSIPNLASSNIPSSQIDIIAPQMLEFEYSCKKYSASVVKVTDGDTAVFDVSLGFGVKLIDQKIRMFGINAPESRTRDPKEKMLGMEAKGKLTNILSGSKEISLCVKPGKERGKYGRILAIVFVDAVNINQLMIDQGYGVPYFGGKRSPKDFDSMPNKRYTKPKGEIAN
tara:strand:- start:722 stop:1231 length:510 start_codon:yes stop_codon:yes gene_type:complete